MKVRAASTSGVLISLIGFSLLVILLAGGILGALLQNNADRQRVTQPQAANSATPPPQITSTALPSAIPTYDTPAPVSTPQPSATREPTPAIEILREHDFGAWKYVASRGGDAGLYAWVSYNSGSIAGIQAFADANRILANQLASGSGEVQIDLTFRDYVAPAQFRTWAASMGLQVADSGVRFIEHSGMRGTLGLPAQGSDFLPQGPIDDLLTTTDPNRGAPLTLRGVFYTRGSINAQQLTAIAADPLVFLPDVTANIVHNELREIGIPNADTVRANAGSPFYQMEDFGLENFH